MLNQDAVAMATWEGQGSAPLLSRILSWVIDACLYASIALVPLFFMPITLDVLELNKQTLLIILSLLGTAAWLGKAVAERRFMLSRSWLHLVVLLFTSGWLVTSLFSTDKYLSLVGNFGQMQWSFATMAAFTLFYFLLVNRTGTTKKLYRLIMVFLGSSIVVAIYGLFQMTGVFTLGWLADFSKAKTFNTVGTINAFGVYMVVPLVLAASLTVFGCREDECVLGKGKKGSVLANVIVWANILLGLAIAVAVDFWVVWAAILFGMVLLVALPIIRSMKIKHPARIAVPAVLMAVSILLLVFRTPLNLNLPSEVSPSAMASWNIAKDVLRDMPVFGSGPGTWIYDYAKYRSPAVNLSEFWTVRFERGLSSFFTLMAMIGIAGMAMWLILIISAIAQSVTHLLKERNDDDWQSYLTVFVGWSTAGFVAFLYNYNFAHHFVFWFLLALLASLVAKKAFIWDAQKNAASSIILSVSFILLSVFSCVAVVVTSFRLAADAAYSSAVMAYRSNNDIDQVIKSLNSAVAKNRYNDVYYRNLSQAYLIKGDQIYQQKKDNPQAPAEIQQYVTAAVDTANKASQISPSNVDNWENLAVIYQAIASFTQGADEFVVKNFQQALDREPNNPVYSLEIGKTYIMRADAYSTLLQAKEEDKRKEAENNVKDALDKAAEWLNKSIQAKPDYAAAHYFLGMVYERQGRTADAVKKLEQVLSVSNKDVGVAFQLAILYYRNSEKDKALNMFEQIVSFAPDYSNARWYLSAMYEENKRYEDALAQVKKVEETNPDNDLVKQRIAYLEDLAAKAKSQPNAKPVVQPLPNPVEEKISGPKTQNEIQKQ